MTVADLITASFRRINVLRGTTTPTSDMSTDAFQRLNDLIDSWANDGLMIPFVRRTTWTITSTKGTLANPYTVGTGGDINVARPSIPADIVVRYQDTSITPTLEYPLQKLTNDQWEAIPQKNLTNTLPVAYFYQPTYTPASGSSVWGSLYLWMIPTSSTLQGVLYAPAQLGAFASTANTILLPPGYNRMLRDNLAVELAPEWLMGVPLDPGIARSAITSLAEVKRVNRRDVIMSTGLGLTIYDINSDNNIMFPN